MADSKENVRLVKCPKCEHEQPDMGVKVQCENCGYAPMPTEED